MNGLYRDYPDTSPVSSSSSPPSATVPAFDMASLKKDLVDKRNNDDTDDEDTQKEGVIERPDLRWRDEGQQGYLLDALNKMRKHKHFCDVVLQVGKQDLFAHRVVLAAASPYLMELFSSSDEKPTRKEVERQQTGAGGGIVYELNGGFEKDALEILIEYAYTANLDIPACRVKAVYVSAVRLRMDRAAQQCAKFLSTYIDISTALELRALPSLTRINRDLVSRVDDFIAESMDQLATSRQMMALDRVYVEVLHASQEEKDLAQAKSLCQLVLDWIHAQWLEDDKLTLQKLMQKKHLLHLGDDNALEDCETIEEGSVKDSEVIQDYKKVNQKIPKQNKKVRRHSAMKPAKPRELLYTRHINQEDQKTADNADEWKVISCTSLNGKSILALVTIDGYLFTCSIAQRVHTNRSRSPPAAFLLSNLSVNNTVTIKSKSPSLSRGDSQDRDFFTPLTNMSQSKCAPACMLDGGLIICGGFDRGECLNNVWHYSPDTNKWSGLTPMLAKRGRFDVTVLNGAIYAIAGSSGQTETNTAEKFDPETKKWKYIASLPAPISNVGVCTLNERVYCIGGTYGQSGNKLCYRLSEDETKWERIASLHTGRSQAGVCSFDGKIWVVGGCDAWNPLASIEIYDPNSNTWKSGPPMNTARRGCALVDHDGLLYVIGGSDGTQSLCTIEVYDPRINLWTTGPNMTVCRVNVSAAVVQGNIWVAGGFSGKVFLNSIEYLDSEREEWTTYISNTETKKGEKSKDEPEVSLNPSEVAQNGCHQESEVVQNGSQEEPQVAPSEEEVALEATEDDASRCDGQLNEHSPICGN